MPRHVLLKFKEIASRITGISIPVFGVSWTPPESERRIIRDLLVVLEDRRAITFPVTRSVDAAKSILNAREELTDALQRIDQDSKATPSIRRMRAACRNFLQAVPPGTDSTLLQKDPESPLYALQKVFARELAVLAAQYGVDLELNLGSLVLEHGGLDERD